MANREEREARRKTVKQRKAKRAALILCAILVLCLSAYGAGSAYAKYVFNRSRSDVVKVKEFYFTSDLLGKTTEHKAYTLNPGKTEFSFELRNSADALRVSTADIKYTVTVSPAATVTVPGVTKDAETGKYIMPVAENGSAVSNTITLSGLALGQTYTVTVEGEAGFKETLKATFTTKAAEPVLFKHLDASDPHYVVLTVWTKDIAGDVKITYPAGLIPDNTDMPGAVTATTGTTETYTDTSSFTGKYASQTYRFFTDSPASYDVDDFTVKIGDTTANPGNP